MKFALLTLLALSFQQVNSTFGLLSSLFHFKLGLLGGHHKYSAPAPAYAPAPEYSQIRFVPRQEPENIRTRARNADYTDYENDNGNDNGNGNLKGRNIDNKKNSGDNSGNINIFISNNGDNKEGILSKGSNGKVSQQFINALQQKKADIMIDGKVYPASDFIEALIKSGVDIDEQKATYILKAMEQNNNGVLNGLNGKAIVNNKVVYPGQYNDISQTVDNLRDTAPIGTYNNPVKN